MTRRGTAPVPKLVSPKVLAVLVPVLWFAALGSAAGAIYCKHRARQLFVELERLNAQRDNLQIEWGQLQLEQSAWSTHAFVERVASTKLHMAMPPPKEIEIIAP
jgi:cell division protein FtsL